MLLSTFHIDYAFRTIVLLQKLTCQFQTVVRGTKEKGENT